MREEFLKRIKNREYVSNKIYQSVKNEIGNFDIKKYNDTVVQHEYIKYKDYFDNMFKDVDDNIILDEEQIKAILSDEDTSLIIAGAGCGKTTTMTAKVKYLVDIKKIDPSKILVMSYTKKATMELEKRILGDFKIPAHITTFHSLGLEYIRNIFNNRKCSVIDFNDREEIFFEYFCKLFEDKEKFNDVIETFDPQTINLKWIFSKWFFEHYKNYNTFEELISDYKKHKIEEAKNSSIGLSGFINNWIEKRFKSERIMTIQGEYVKSLGEAVIANFLYKKGIIYSYEKVYTELMDDNKTYKPDFTIELGGKEIYIEYFGMDDEKYLINKKKKIDFHKEKNNILIEIDRLPINKIEYVLDNKLKELGFIYNEKTPDEIYGRILDNNKLSLIYPFKDFFYSVIDAIKESVSRETYVDIVGNYIDTLISSEKELALKQFKYINNFYIFYQDKLYGAEDYKFDYSDLLYYAIKYIESIGVNNNLNFEYIIIDEYQDISQYKYELTRKTLERNNSKITAVGDDWQSIFAFSGSRIEYTYNFEKYFKDAVLFKISRTYRNSQELLNVSGEFVMRNPDQIKKQLISNKRIDNPIIFVEYENDEYDKLKDVILKIHEENPTHNILVLARTNEMINKCFDKPYLNDEIGTKISFVGYDDIDLEGMTIHKSKGLTFDEVILIGLNNKFPSSNKNTYFITSLFKYPNVEEKIPFAEERRLFYVALTRTKNRVYLLINNDESKQSIFIKELRDICDNA